MIDPVVHAALVTVFTVLVQWVFAAIGIDLGNEVAEGLATVIVAYILSLLGLGLWQRVTAKARGLAPDSQWHYKPPFT